MKYILTILCSLFLRFSLAQSTPAVQNLPYAQDFSSLPSTSTTYPAGWQGWQLSTGGSSNSFRTTAPSSDLALTASSSASTVTGGVHNFNGKIGILASSSSDPSLCLAINTTGKINVMVTFDLATIRNPFNNSTETRRNNVELQYNVGGITGTFTSITGSIYRNNTTAQTTGTTPRNGVRYQFALPAVCENQSLVVLRWVQRDSVGAGSRPSFCIDNVIVCPAPIVTANVTPNCGSNSGAISLNVSAGLPPYTFAWDTINKNGPSFSVAAASKTSQHPYFGVGFPVGYVLDGIQGKELNLTRGLNYTFLGTFPGHPFHISTSATGGNFTNEIISGVTNSQLQGGAMVFTPNNSHPGLLYYQCGAHLNMGWRININNGQLTTAQINNLSAGTYTVAVRSSDGCITTAIITVGTGTPIEVTATSNSPLCVEDLLTLTGSGADNYQWTGPAGFSASGANVNLPNVSAANQGYYVVTGSSNQGCISIDSTQVITLARPAVFSFLPTSGAVGTEVNADGTGFADIANASFNGISISPSVLNDSTLSFTVPSGASTSTLTLSNLQGCTSSGGPIFSVLNVSNLNLKLFLEGFYTGNGSMSSPFQNGIADTFTVVLFDSLNLSSGPVFSTAGVIDTLGNGDFTFPPAVIGNRYYIVIRHRNSIETWSKNTVLLSAMTSYDFTQ
jgi:hypothetical protein